MIFCFVILLPCSLVLVYIYHHVVMSLDGPPSLAGVTSLRPLSFFISAFFWCTLSLSLEFTTLTDGWTHALTECLGMNDTYHLRYLVSVE